MLLLAVDTSGPTGSLALAAVDGGKVLKLHESSWIKKAMHSEVATVRLQELLKGSGATFRSLTHLAVNCGPGSFTGLRVGINMVKSLAYALALPVAPLNTLETLAFREGLPGERIFVALRAVQNFFYCAAYTKGETGMACILEPRSALEEELEKLAQGLDKVRIEGRTLAFDPLTSANVLLPLLTQLTPPRPYLNWKQIEPLYIRGSEAEEKLKKKGLLL